MLTIKNGNDEQICFNENVPEHLRYIEIKDMTREQLVERNKYVKSCPKVKPTVVDNRIKPVSLQAQIKIFESENKEMITSAFERNVQRLILAKEIEERYQLDRELTD